MTTTSELFVLHTGIAVDGGPGRVTVFDYEEDAREIFNFMSEEVLVSINQGLSITRVSVANAAEREAVIDNIDDIVAEDFEGYNSELIAEWSSSQDSWDEGIFNEDSQDIVDRLVESSDFVIHS